MITWIMRFSACGKAKGSRHQAHMILVRRIVIYNRRHKIFEPDLNESIQEQIVSGVMAPHVHMCPLRVKTCGSTRLVKHLLHTSISHRGCCLF